MKESFLPRDGDAAFPYLAWINEEEEFIRANRDKTRDDDLDEGTDEPPVRRGEENHVRSIAKGSPAQADAVPGNQEPVRRARAKQEMSHGSCCQEAAYGAGKSSGDCKHESSTACMEDEDRASILDGLDEQVRHAHRSDHELLGRSLEDEKKAHDSTPLDHVDRTKIKRLLNNKNLSRRHRVAIQCGKQISWLNS